MSRILLVEDHTSLGGTIVEYLRRGGHTVDWAQTLADARLLLADTRFDLLLLDLGMPDGDGLGLLGQKPDGLPALVLTARGELNDRVEGLDRGAEDYLVKPFDLEELGARCRVLLRRAGNVSATRVTAGKVCFDPATQSLDCEGQEFPLSRRERQLLVALILRAGKVCTRAYLENQLYDQSEPVTPNALETTVSRLRHQLEAQDCGLNLRTIRGVGYLLEAVHDIRAD
ncbi:response regulator transcription factor [Hyphomonas sp.]|uniref:response regulator transcription factor n=1 Tax=Hyphomonas sp. TaxID=87 RepID=UPI0039188592